MKKTNKLISILLALAMFLSMAPVTVFAAEAPPTAEIGGKTYYELDSADDLDWFAAQVNGGNTTINATLTKDITYNSGTMSSSTTGARVWTPIGTYEMPFEGIINGNGYTISGLYCKDPEGSPNLALVSRSVNATITNVAVTNFYFESEYGLNAGLASYAAGATIYNCYAQGSIYAKDAGAAAAGICAAVFGHSRTEILNCLSDVALKVDDPSDFTVSGVSVRNYIGGIICTGDKNNPVLIRNTVYITDRYNGTVYNSDSSASHFEVYDSEGMPASKLATGEIAYILGKGWGQKLGTDSIPEIGNSNIVNYGYVSCDADAQKVYTNSATNPNYPFHYDSETDSDSACDFCGTNLHTHSFTYFASGDTITAVCENTDGSCPDSEGTLTISAPADLYADGVTAKEAVVDNQLVEAVDYTVTYSTADGSAPKTAGTYTASVTLGGATASVKFTLLSYAAKVTDADGNELEGSPYKTFAEAVTVAESSENSTLTLIDNVTLTEEQYIKSGKFTLDLNGKTLLHKSIYLFEIQSDADITIKDSGENGTIETKEDGYAAIYNYGILTVENGTIKGSVGISNIGTLNFKNGEIEADTYSAIQNNGTAYIHNGKFKSANGDAISNHSDSTIYVYDGEFDGGRGIDNHGTAYIEGGEFTGNSYAALNLLGGTVEITGGSFTGKDDENGYYTGTPYGEWTVDYSEGATLILKGGEFPNGFLVDDTTANTLLAEGYAFYDKDGSKITVADDAKIIDGYVQVKEHFVASVTDKDGNELEYSPYKTFADAVTAAQSSEGSTVTLLDDIALTNAQQIESGKLTLDLNGKTLSNKDDYVVFVNEGADLTIKDSGTNGKIQNVGTRAAVVNRNGTITVESGSIHSEVYGIDNTGTLSVKGGKIYSETRTAIENGGSGTASIYDGAVIESAKMSAVSSFATLHVYGGELSGRSALTTGGNTYIHGGKLTGREYAGINMLGGTCEILGGTITGKDLSNGYYSGTPYGEWTFDCNEDATLILKGGEYPNGLVIDIVAANESLADGYHFRDADGKIIEVAEDAKVINGYVKVSKGADLADAVITLGETEFTYSGKEHKPTVIVTIGGKALTEGKDYTVSYSNNINAGTATVTIKAVGQTAGGIAGGGENIGNSSNSGDITESVYTGEVTKEFTINKKPVTVTATAPDKVYDGTTDVDASAIVIIFEGIADGDTVGYTVKEAWYNGANAGVDKIIPIVFNVTGEDAENYSFPTGGGWMAPNYYVEATADITAKDISDGFIVLGEALIYNGKEQTQTVEKVLPSGTAPEATYTVSGNKATNVGIYLLTVTGTGNFTGEAKIAYEIALDDECISHLDKVADGDIAKWNVKSTDRASLEYVIDQLNNAVTDIADADKKSEWADIREACEDMLRIINSIELLIADVEEDYAGFSEDTVKSSDIPALDEIVSKVNEIKDRYGFNLTDEENQKLDDILDSVEKFKKRITETEEKLEEIAGIENEYNPETVTSDDKAAIEEAIAEIDAVNPDNLTDEQKAEYKEIKAEFEALLDEIAAAGAEVDAIGVELEMFDEKRVTKFWEDDIEALKAKIDELLANENMGEAEKAKLNEYKSQCDNLIEIINTPLEYFSLRFFYLIWDLILWIWNSVADAFTRLFGVQVIA